MFRQQFIVLPSDGLWTIRHDGASYGSSYRTERGAILAAIDAADRIPRTAFEPRVMVQSRLTGELNVAWVRGEPYPADFVYYRASVAATREDDLRRRESLVA